MLLSFSVSNFRSFKTEQTLDLIASKRLGKNEDSPHCCQVPGSDEHVLRIASLYGANGAGKSNLVRAISLVQKMILTGSSPQQALPYNPFLLSVKSNKEPTYFELRFIEEGEVFRYGISFDEERIQEEWLDVYDNKKENCLFNRICDKDELTKVNLGKAINYDHASNKLKALAEVGARPNQLFFSEIINLDDPEAQGPRIRSVIRWVKKTLNLIEPDKTFVSIIESIARNEAFAKFASMYLREANTGISHLEIHTEDIPESEKGTSFLKYIYNKIIESTTSASNLLAQDREIILSEMAKNLDFKIRKIMASHESNESQRTELPLNEESDGSKRLLQLLPALYRLSDQGGVFVIDELERSMHPMLARKFVEYFLKAARNRHSQLIFTTHESTLLDLDLMRRDGIWFAEKNDEGETHLYSLADFKVRNDLRIEKGYLQGRFGAVPFLGGIDRLMEQEAAAEAGA
jgi:uncharacterized protein